MINYRRPFRAWIDETVYFDFEDKSLALYWIKQMKAKNTVNKAEIENTITKERWTV